MLKGKVKKNLPFFNGMKNRKKKKVRGIEDVE
jgi:hypothetical protein